MASLSPRSCCMAAARSCVAKLGRHPLLGCINSFKPFSCTQHMKPLALQDGQDKQYPGNLSGRRECLKPICSFATIMCCVSCGTQGNQVLSPDSYDRGATAQDTE